MSNDPRTAFDEPEESGERYQILDADAFHPDWLEVRHEVNYVAGWREARTTVSKVRALLSKAGVQVSSENVWASARADGSGVVCLDPPTAAALARLVDEAMRERQEGAPRIRGAPKGCAA